MRAARPTRRLAAWMAPPLAAALALSLGASCDKHEPRGELTFTSPQVDPLALNADGSLLYAADTTSGTVSVISTATRTTLTRVAVGLEPVSLAVRPGAQELWVSNHVSDSLSVIDIDPASETYHTVVQTVQELDASGASLFDEPTGIAFREDGARAYVALSSRNDVAVIDAGSSPPVVLGRIHIPAQEPRALAVRGSRLYVLSFESFNQTELSACPDPDETQGAPQCTLDLDDLVDFVIASPNIPGASPGIVVDGDLPDRDLFVIDIAPASPSENQVIQSVVGIGTLLYGIAVAADDRVFVSVGEARNSVNGTAGQNLIDLQNRMFLNRIARVACAGACGSPTLWDLDSAPGSPEPDPLARPYALRLSGDGSTLFGTAAGTSKLFALSAASGQRLDTLALDAGVPADAGRQIPRGLVLRSGPQGQPLVAYVLNSLENTVSVVDVSTPSAMVHVANVPVGTDPTPAAVRRGRIAFESAFASSSGTFACSDCHPDGNTDQLLWRIGGACFHAGCTGDDEVRSTMPVRGLKNTLPLHWDGALGDPFGGGNGAVGANGNGGTDCDLGGADGDHDCFRNLVDASLTGVMCDQAGGCDPGPSGLAGALTAQERDDMATFLASVSYPPARSRRVDDTLSPAARTGFSDFFIDQPPFFPPGDLGDVVGVSTCADMNSGCHALPLGADTNSPTLGGFDAPTMRGMTDRVLQFSIGITAAEEVQVFFEQPRMIDLNFGIPLPSPGNPFPYDPAAGLQELSILGTAFAVFTPVYGGEPGTTFQMFEEASTGHSGAFGRQVTLNANTTAPANQAGTESLLAALELADARGLVNLAGSGLRRAPGGDLGAANLSYREASGDYRNGDDSVVLGRAQLLAEARQGDLVMTFTALPRQNVTTTAPQPLLSVTTNANRSMPTGETQNPSLPFLPGDHPMTLRGIDVAQGASVIVDGEPDPGATIACVNGGAFTPYCSSQRVRIMLSSPGTLATGLHLLQVQNPAGSLSVEFPFCNGVLADCQL